MYSKKKIFDNIDSLKKSISNVDKQLFETRNRLLGDIDLSRIEQEKVYETVKTRVVKLKAKKKNLTELKERLSRNVDVNERNIKKKLEEKKKIDNWIRDLEKKKKQLPKVKKEISFLRREKASFEKKEEKTRVFLDQLSLVIKETLMQEQQLRKIRKRLDREKERVL
ncbi:MAG: hypothetical protein GON13_02675 [Nanoarchaeota archaeon]|nr:hypothetical protein [Nanoarchaeota archaeon]